MTVIPNRPFDSLRRTEYTGTNRCWPCTFLNTILSFVVAGVIYVLLFVAAFPPWLAASVALLGLIMSLGVVYFRGYLVPATPRISERFFPANVKRAFGEEIDSSHVSGETRPSAGAGAFDPSIALVRDDQDRVLRGADRVIEETNGAIELSDHFRAEWERHMTRLHGIGEPKWVDALCDTLYVDRDLVTISHRATVGRNRLERDPDALIRVFDAHDRLVNVWPSTAALVADLGAAAGLSAAIPDWDGLGESDRERLVHALRIFLESCPSCPGRLVQRRLAIESCCGGDDAHYAIVDCEACGARLAEYRL